MTNYITTLHLQLGYITLTGLPVNLIYFPKYHARSDDIRTSGYRDLRAGIASGSAEKRSARWEAGSQALSCVYRHAGGQVPSRPRKDGHQVFKPSEASL
jgi:hypothetical protein